MKISRLSLSFTSAEVSSALKTAIEKSAQGGSQIPPELADLDVEIAKGNIVLSTKKKMAFMPVKLSASIALRPAEGGEGIVITLAKVSAGPIGSQMIASQLMGEISHMLADVPGCSVSGTDITLNKEFLAARAPWLAVPGRVNQFGIIDDRVEIDIG